MLMRRRPRVWLCWVFLLWCLPQGALAQPASGPIAAHVAKLQAEGKAAICGPIAAKTPERAACEAVCEQPPSDVCLFTLRFGQPPPEDAKQLGPQAVAKALGLPESEHSALRWYMASELRWRDPNNPTRSAKKQPLETLNAISALIGQAGKAKNLTERLAAWTTLRVAMIRHYGIDDVEVLLPTLAAAETAYQLGKSALELKLWGEAHALAVATLPEDHPKRADTTMRYGWALMRSGDATRGPALLHQGIRALRAVYGDAHFELITAYHLASEGYLALEQPARAKLWAEDALRVSTRLVTIVGRDAVTPLLDLAEAYLALHEPIVGPLACESAAMVLLQYQDKGLRQRQLTLCARVAAWKAKQERRDGDHAHRVDEAKGRALLASATQTYKKSLGQLRDVIVRDTQGEGVMTAQSLDAMAGLAHIFWEVGDRESALETSKDVISVIAQTRGAKHPRTLIATLDHSERLIEHGAHVEALALLEPLVQRFDTNQPALKLTRARAHHALARARWRAGDLVQARASILQAVTLQDEVFLEDSARDMDDMHISSRMIGVRLLQDNAMTLLDDPKQARALGALLLARQGLATRAALHEGELRRARDAMSPELVERFDAWRARHWRGDVFHEAHARDEALLRQALPTLDALATPAAPSEAALCARLKKERAGALAYVFSIHEAPGEKPRQRADALLYDSRCRATRVPLAKPDAIAAAVKLYRERIAGAEACYAQRGEPLRCLGALGQVEEASSALSALIWEPVASLVAKAKVRRLYVVPDYKLVQIPLDALVLADGRYLIETQEIALIPALDALTREAPKARAGDASARALVVGDVNYARMSDGPQALRGVQRCGRGGCAALPQEEVASMVRGDGGLGAVQKCSNKIAWGALQTEASAVAELLSERFGQEVLLARGEAASEGALRELMSEQRLLHLATHGYWDSSSECRDVVRGELNSVEDLYLSDEPYLDIARAGAVVLAGANGASASAGDDGYLNGGEIARMNLSNTALVVLSACETGLGLELIGEGSLGLSRGFALAGAHQIVSALWQVPSDPTSALFRDMYTAMMQRKAPADPITALRRAKLDALKRWRAQGVGASSYLWGAFMPLVVRH